MGSRPNHFYGTVLKNIHDHGLVGQGVTSIVVEPATLERMIKNAVADALISSAGLQQQEVFDRAEAAEFLRIKVSTLDKLAKRNLIHPNITTRKPLYARGELLRFLRENTAALD